MRPSAAGPGLRWGALVSLIGAPFAVVGVFLAWASLTSIGTVVAAVETTRGVAAVVATAAGLVALLAAVLGLAQRESIATTGLPGGTEALEFARDFAAEFNEELGLDIPVPRVETETGVYLTLVGGVVASAGGLVALRQEASHRRGLHFGRSGHPRAYTYG